MTSVTEERTFLDPFIYKTYEIHCVSDKRTSKGWFPKAFIKRGNGDARHLHTVFGGKDETYSTELVANAIATSLAKAWIDSHPSPQES
jgi:hypothetical protein